MTKSDEEKLRDYDSAVRLLKLYPDGPDQAGNVWDALREGNRFADDTLTMRVSVLVANAGQVLDNARLADYENTIAFMKDKTVKDSDHCLWDLLGDFAGLGDDQTLVKRVKAFFAWNSEAGTKLHDAYAVIAEICDGLKQIARADKDGSETEPVKCEVLNNGRSVQAVVLTAFDKFEIRLTWSDEERDWTVTVSDFPSLGAYLKATEALPPEQNATLSRINFLVFELANKLNEQRTNDIVTMAGLLMKFMSQALTERKDRRG